MSLLKKKLALDPIQSLDQTEVTQLFTDLHSEWVKQYSNMAALEAFSAKTNFSVNMLKILTQETNGLFYALGNTDALCLILIELSPSLAKNVIDAKLGAKSNAEKALTLLDLIALQPMAETALHALTNLGVAAAEAIICGRCIGAANITDIGPDIDTRQKWTCMHFPLKTETDSADDNNTVKIYFAEPMLTLLDATIQSMQSKTALDPSDPWAHHMSDIIMDTTQMLEVVIEDVTMSIAECTRLELGHVISLPGASHTRLNVYARSAHGVQVLTTSTLGVYKANKAVKLLDDIDHTFFADIADIEHRQPQ